MAPSLWRGGTAQLRGEGHSAICQCALEPPLKSYLKVWAQTQLCRGTVCHTLGQGVKGQPVSSRPRWSQLLKERCIWVTAGKSRYHRIPRRPDVGILLPVPAKGLDDH